MQLIDSHTHLYLPEFDSDRDEIISRALENDVVRLLLPNIDSNSVIPMLEMVKKYPQICYPMIGVHPGSIKSDYINHLETVKKYLSDDRFIAIGEIGIDLHWDTTYKKEQEIVFREQVKLAEVNNLPVVIHSRKSLSDILNILDDMKLKSVTGVFHSFTGNIEEAREIIKRGFMLGIGGILTYKNSGLDEVIASVDLGNIILETDSPYLAPVPKRGKRNESSYLKYVAEKIANIKEFDIKDVAAITTENCKKLFKLY